MAPSWSLLSLLVVALIAVGSASAPQDVAVAADRIDSEETDKISDAEMQSIRTKVDAMSDAQLTALLAAAMPHQRERRTIGTVRRCLEKVRCLFGNLKRHKRETSPAAVLRAISKLLGVANNAAKELLGKRLGGGNSGFDLGSLFRGPKSSASSSSSAASDSVASSSSTAALSQALDDADNATGEASEIVEEKVCDQRCNLSVLVYRRLRRLLRRL